MGNTNTTFRTEIQNLIKIDWGRSEVPCKQVEHTAKLWAIFLKRSSEEENIGDAVHWVLETRRASTGGQQNNGETNVIASWRALSTQLNLAEGASLNARNWFGCWMGAVLCFLYQWGDATECILERSDVKLKSLLSRKSARVVAWKRNDRKLANPKHHDTPSNTRKWNHSDNQNLDQFCLELRSHLMRRRTKKPYDSSKRVLEKKEIVIQSVGGEST